MTDQTGGTPILELQGLHKVFDIKHANPFKAPDKLRAVDGATLRIMPGQTYALVGESGSGKSTLGRVAVRLDHPTDGTIIFDGRDITSADPATLRRLRPDVQVVFQDPYGSLNPRMRIGDIIGEPLKVFKGMRGKALDDEVRRLMESVGLDPSRAKSRPRALSGGQRQRVGIARAIALKPKLILADEALSALDVSVQAQIANLMVKLQKEMGISYLFIAHGLPIVRQMAHQVGVMYLGRIVEQGPADTVFQNPEHPYTKSLMQASPEPNPEQRGKRFILKGEIPSPMDPPSGCRFRTRCPIATERCKEDPPIHVTGDHLVECHYPGRTLAEFRAEQEAQAVNL
ncbi:MAG: ATP-binding cassette domain-containing protein [Propionibacterium sp.]|nr:ATP-binding cassette domain-containing protein [Propionibacterium sp.]